MSEEEVHQVVLVGKCSMTERTIISATLKVIARLKKNLGLFLFTKKKSIKMFPMREYNTNNDIVVVYHYTNAQLPEARLQTK